MITIHTTVNAPIAQVWKFWTDPAHIVNWAFASDDWEAPVAENDLRIDGKFKTTMSAKDKSTSFDFTGVYTNINDQEKIEYTMDDGRKVSSTFEETPEGVLITQSFDPETENSEEMQRAGWQSILDNFKKYVEANH